MWHFDKKNILWYLIRLIPCLQSFCFFALNVLTIFRYCFFLRFFSYYGQLRFIYNRSQCVCVCAHTCQQWLHIDFNSLSTTFYLYSNYLCSILLFVSYISTFSLASMSSLFLSAIFFCLHDLRATASYFVRTIGLRIKLWALVTRVHMCHLHLFLFDHHFSVFKYCVRLACIFFVNFLCLLFSLLTMCTTMEWIKSVIFYLKEAKKKSLAVIQISLTIIIIDVASTFYMTYAVT